MIGQRWISICASAIAVATLVSVGCTVATHDATSDQGPLKMTLPQAECLKQTIPVIQSYFEGASNANDVSTSWDCASGALTMFTTSTRGANPDYYTSRELRTFLETFYLGDIKVSDQLLTEAMRIKQLLLGGADDRLTRPELAQAQNAIQVLRIESLRVLPYIKYIVLSASVDDAAKNPADVENAIAAFSTSVSTLGSLFGRSPDTYSVDDLESLFNELQPLFKNWTGIQKAISYLPTLDVIKALVLNPPGNRIAPSEWQPLLTNAGRGYALYLRFHYLMNQQNLMTGSGLAQMTTALEELTSIVKTGVEAKPSKTISYTQIDSAIDEVIRLGLLDENLRDTSLKSAVRTALGLLLNPASNGVRPKVTGLNETLLTQLHATGAAFLNMQHAYDDVVARAVAADPTVAGKPVPWKTFVSLWSTETTQFSNAQEDLRKLMTLASPLSFRDNGTVIFDNRLSYLSVSLPAFTRYNWESVATRLVVQGYATDAVANRWTGLTQAQLKAFFADVHDLGADLQLLEPTDDTLWQSSFTESNMFMLSAVNDDHMSYFEMFDYVSDLLGASTMSNRMYADAKDACAHIGVDAFNRPTLDVACFRSRYGLKFASVHAELPWWVKTQGDAGVAGWPALEQALEAAARTNGFSDDPISSSDITRMTMVMQYIESLFVRFDSNRDGVVNYDEAQKALPLFKALLSKASGFTDDHKINALFMSIMKNGKPPTSILDKIYFQIIWLSMDLEWKRVTADRLKLLNVIGALKSAAK